MYIFFIHFKIKKRYFKIHKLLPLLLDYLTVLLLNCSQNNKKITDPVEEDFLYGGMILEEMENEGKETFKGILKKYEMNTDMDENIKKAIKTVRKQKNNYLWISESEMIYLI